ncbi:fatty acid desaturase-domain-containing protein [Baffinella frigidus]|nr:fatty acid desaturase-domain-containing protein [Cryptophyta sp. CCMP2293]|mmetsp:Transcript_10193/g.22714  ORF Transcript_10193/g.22714 Transcript_10193/m.22714 type:complete len:350 (+) Transcript_10193:70-1119(+)
MGRGSGKGSRKAESKGDAAERRADFFFRAEGPEPHAARKLEILKVHPEIKQLFGPEPMTKWTVLGTVALQVGMAWLTLEWSWPAYLAAVYIVGATANHSLFLAIHELSHNLGFKDVAHNKYLAMFANFPIFIAYSITFKPYHMEHHRYQGDDGIDTDIPTALEAWMVTGSATGYIDHTIRKAVFMFGQIFAYAFRPMLVKPDLMNYDGWLLMNWVVQICLFDIPVIYCLGLNGALYFLLSTFFAGSIHPTAGHFLAEHYVTEGKTETYSYYGPLNMLAYNVGYHNEHHDFPNIAWRNLPKVREMAPEFYNDLPQCKSWPGIIIQYIFDDNLSPYSRVKTQSGQAKTKAS